MAGHGLLRKCQAFWELEEASGVRGDRHVGRNLTDVNTVGSATGKVGMAADFEAANGELLTRASEAALQGGERSFMVGCWVKPESAPSEDRGVISKVVGATGALNANNEYHLRLNESPLSYDFLVFNAVGVVQAIGGTPTAGVWMFLVGWFDLGTRKAGISTDGGAAALSGVLGSNANVSTTTAFVVGGIDADGNQYDGLIDQAFKMDRAPVLHELKALHNRGFGVTYKRLRRPYRHRMMV